MATDYTHVALIAGVRRRSSMPTTSVVGSADADIIAYANEELRLGLVSEILRLREGYFLRDSDTAITSSNSVVSYRVPQRAIGGKLRNVCLLDSSGLVLGAPLAEVPDERLGFFASGTGLAGYRVKGQSIDLIPNSVTTASSLRLSYFIQPNQIVTAGTQAITNINTGTLVLTVSSTTGFTTSTPVDLVSNTPGFECLSIDLTPTAVTSTTITLPSLPSTLAVGDHLCLAGQSPIPQIPSEFHPILQQRVVCAWLQAQGKRDELGTAESKLARMEAAIGVISSPRVDSGAKKLVNRNSSLGHWFGSRRWGI